MYWNGLVSNLKNIFAYTQNIFIKALIASSIKCTPLCSAFRKPAKGAAHGL
jgi:hypothetical protein